MDFVNLAIYNILKFLSLALQYLSLKAFFDTILPIKVSLKIPVPRICFNAMTSVVFNLKTQKWVVFCGVSTRKTDESWIMRVLCFWISLRGVGMILKLWPNRFLFGVKQHLLNQDSRSSL